MSRDDDDDDKRGGAESDGGLGDDEDDDEKGLESASKRKKRLDPPQMLPAMTSTLTTLVRTALLASMLISATCAVFYYKHNEPDYPRIGKRTLYAEDSKLSPQGVEGSFILSDTIFPALLNQNKRGLFTQGSAGIPRLGRRDLLLGDKRGLFTQGSAGYPRLGKREEVWYDKKGVFTQGSSGYPRIGRQSLADAWNDSTNLAYQKGEESKDDADEEKEQGQGADSGDDVKSLPSSLQFIFIEMDADNDGKLSKDEFLTGMQILKSQTLLC
ncbi:hypothetical protein Btru_055359 [Bulinus truncatus]|nr:hypothetical protein Btru_055359 [Bulinus truncatus]